MIICVVYPDHAGEPIEKVSGLWLSREPMPNAWRTIGFNVPERDGMLIGEPPNLRPDLYAHAMRHTWLPVWAYSSEPFAGRPNVHEIGPVVWDCGPLGELPELLPESERSGACLMTRWRPETAQGSAGRFIRRRFDVEAEHITGFTWPEKLGILNRFSRAVCGENWDMLGYMTEKLTHCLLAGCAPIYWGYGEQIVDIDSMLTATPEQRREVGLLLAERYSERGMWAQIARQA